MVPLKRKNRSPNARCESTRRLRSIPTKRCTETR